MEAPVELLSALPALVTVLALLLAWLLVRRGAAPAPPVSLEPPAEASQPPQPRAPEPAAAPEEGLEEPAAALTEVEEAMEARQEEELDPAGEKNLPRGDEPEEEDEVGEGTFSFKYSPGKLRGNQYKQMMTKEELEEEQRVQREQLDAIFKLMKDNKETFGEMSDGDMQEQLRLYDM
ncbi:PREDICTED: matrix-remodeling-associated protein 7 [Chrysochloris asiatica]|uniref:Matrix-remodeling-associated protein 7 n=1 Tax=Chrysochloris asiatica TaxID=185453 RepID=A0A9B0TXR4_CHRAS|nr:PREDICTED: matrix-remodeling-associated protein 7 [Chrysochloris asiatica]